MDSRAPSTDIKYFPVYRNGAQRCIQLNLLNSSEATDRTDGFACTISWHRELTPVTCNQPYFAATATTTKCYANHCTVRFIS